MGEVTPLIAAASGGDATNSYSSRPCGDGHSTHQNHLVEHELERHLSLFDLVCIGEAGEMRCRKAAPNSYAKKAQLITRPSCDERNAIDEAWKRSHSIHLVQESAQPWARAFLC